MPSGAPRQACPRRFAFQTKPEIASGQIPAARVAGLSAMLALADAAYGNDGEWCAGITAEGLADSVGCSPAC
jgi:SRSO17 transposase